MLGCWACWAIGRIGLLGVLGYWGGIPKQTALAEFFGMGNHVAEDLTYLLRSCRVLLVYFRVDVLAIQRKIEPDLGLEVFADAVSQFSVEMLRKRSAPVAFGQVCANRAGGAANLIRQAVVFCFIPSGTQVFL